MNKKSSAKNDNPFPEFSAELNLPENIDRRTFLIRNAVIGAAAAMTEQFKLGIVPPIRESGDIADTPACTLESPTGSVPIDRGVICALRHVHMTPEDALRYGVRDKSFVRVRIAGDRELIFGDVLVRVDPSFKLAMHIDTDEGNAANVKTGAHGYIDQIQSEGYQSS